MNKLSHDVLMKIEPYTRRPQKKELLRDIQNFHSSLNTMLAIFMKITHKLYIRDHINDSMMLEYFNFYAQFVKSLYLTDRDKTIYLYYLYHGELCRIVRVFWASKSVVERNHLSSELIKYFNKLLYRPGDIEFPET